MSETLDVRAATAAFAGGAARARRGGPVPDLTGYIAEGQVALAHARQVLGMLTDATLDAYWHGSGGPS
ncbi:MAG: hypothetical protein ACTHJ6_06085 [Oryzihumus sp.]